MCEKLKCICLSKEVLKEADSIENGIGLPDWKLVICLAFAWVCITLVLIKGIIYYLIIHSLFIAIIY